MIKKLVILGLLVTFSFARILGGVAVLVNGEPITTFEIKDYAKKAGVSINDALNALIQDKLADLEADRLGITVSNEEINSAIEQLAKKNHLDVETFKRRVVQEGKTIYELKQSLAKQIKKEKLFSQILQGSIEKPTEEDLKRLYNQHYKDFNFPTKVDVVQYVSLYKERLATKKRTPAFPIDGVSEAKTTLPLNAIPPALAQTLVKTKTGANTPILSIGKGRFIYFKVLKKYYNHVPFDKVKNKLLMAYIAERRQAKLVEYFEKRKAEADIQVLRKP